MLRRSLQVLAVALVTSTPALAQVPGLDIRLGAHAAMPTAELGDFYDAGFGVYGRVGMPVGPVKLMASATWNRLRGIEGAGTTDLDVVSGQVGPHFSTALLDIGLEAAYFSQFQELGIAPNVSVKLLRYEITASYNTTFQDPKGSWLTFGVGLRF
ncbi:MAG: hypothetical protein KJZ74_12465 [Gemmatimonadales bacterium]|nr:hypothetical protein [Gemmatimonadota bacterium]MCL4214715.1 hypothetical protein [Gemmatimonadales bacterium]